MKHYAQAEIGIENFMKNLRYSTIQSLEEDSLYWFEESIDNATIEQYYYDDVIIYLKSKGLTDKELVTFKEDIYSNISQAINTAYRDDNIRYIIECIKDAIEDFAQEIGCSGYYYLDCNGRKTPYIYEAFDIRFYYTKKQFEAIILRDFVDNYSYTKKELREWKHDYCQEYVESFSYNQPLLDSRWTPNDNGWLNNFKDYEDVSYAAFQERKAKQKDIKNKIKSNVALIYR